MTDGTLTDLVLCGEIDPVEVTEERSDASEKVVDDNNVTPSTLDGEDPVGCV